MRTPISGQRWNLWVVMAAVLTLMFSLIAGSSARTAQAAPGATAAGVPVPVAAARVRGQRVKITVRGERYGKKVTIILKGVKGRAKGAKKTRKVKRTAVMKRLVPGVYRVNTRKVTKGGAVAKAKKAAPKRVRVTGARGAAVRVTYREVKRAASEDVATVRVATYNICRPAVCPDQGGPWLQRKEAILRTINAAQPRLLALQEVDDYDGVAAEMSAALARYGYAKAPTGSDRCKPVACANHIFYRTDTFTYLSEGGPGSVRPSAFTPSRLYDQTVKDRPLGYALLEHRETGRRVFAISLHLPPRYQGEPQLALKATKVRNAVGQHLPGWINRHLQSVGGKAPVQLLLGDVNTWSDLDSQTPQRFWTDDGYRNAETAKQTRNADAGTINFTSADKRWQGFPPRPRRYSNVGPKIDVIFTKNIPETHRHEIVLNLRRDGDFDKRFQGSDHNMVTATIPIPKG